MIDPLQTIARTFQRGEDHDPDWFEGRASAAVANLNAAGWRIVANDTTSPGVHTSIAVNLELHPEGPGAVRQSTRKSKGPRS